jgi:hypothetical protein
VVSCLAYRVGVELVVQAEGDGLREKALGRQSSYEVWSCSRGRCGGACWNARTGSIGVAVRCQRCGGCSGEAPQSHPRHCARGGLAGGPLPAAVDRARQDLPGRRSVGQPPTDCSIVRAGSNPAMGSCGRVGSATATRWPHAAQHTHTLADSPSDQTNLLPAHTP